MLVEIPKEMNRFDHFYYFKTGIYKIPDGELDIGKEHIYITNNKGRLHRIDGPAFMTTSDDADEYQWWINGRCVLSSIRNTLPNWACENNIDLDNLTDIDVSLIKMWSFGFYS